MPGYKGHLVGGLITYAVVAYMLKDHNPSAYMAFEWCVFACAGSLFPDVDVKSKGQKWLYWFLCIGFFILLISRRYMLLGILSIIALVPMMVRHRGLFHKLWFIIAAPSTVAYIMAGYFPKYQTVIMYDTLFFVVGAVSHLWLDLGFRRMIKM